ncbi:protein of unknown function [Burkholderia multivorans]
MLTLDSGRVYVVVIGENRTPGGTDAAQNVLGAGGGYRGGAVAGAQRVDPEGEHGRHADVAHLRACRAGCAAVRRAARATADTRE